MFVKDLSEKPKKFKPEEKKIISTLLNKKKRRNSKNSEIPQKY